MRISAKNICSVLVERVTSRTLSSMALAGVLAFGTQAFSMDIDEAMKTKPVDTPTLEYLKTNDVLIPQKDYQRDEDGNIIKVNNKPVFIDSTPIKSTGSAYTIEKINALSGDENNIEFTYTTSDKDGNLTDTYYKINYDVKTPDDYKTPEGYTETSTRINNNLTQEAVTNVVFKDISTTSSGGVIYNTQNKSDVNIIADFINNSAESDGGAIYNYGIIGNITGNFINNSASNSTFNHAYGGAIYNRAEANNVVHIGIIKGDFIGNSVNVSGSKNAYGGAIYTAGYNSKAVISGIFGDFINNSANAISGSASGGALCNHANKYDTGSSIANIVGSFVNNSVKSSLVWGGAIDNTGIIGSITGDFINNSATATGSRFTYGGAIYNYGLIGNVTGDFIANSAVSKTADAYGGAIYNNGSNAKFGDIIGNFLSNSAVGLNYAYGGAIYNTGTIGDITGDFINNSATATSGSARGGAIYNEPDCTIGAKDDNGNIVGGIINSSFIGNYAKSENYVAQGGAIYQYSSTLNLISQDGYTSVIKDNYTESQGARDDNAIYLNGSNLNFKMTNGGKFYVADNIDGDATKTNTVNITGDSVDNTMFYMLNDIRNSAVNVGATTLNTINNDIHTYNFKSLTLTDNVNMLADVDLENQVMDRFTANNYGTHNGNLNVLGMNLLNDAPEDRDITAIYFAQNGLKDNVTHNGLEIPNEKYQNFEAYTPIYKYNVTYSTDYAETNSTEDNQLEDGGYFLFTKGDKYVRPTGGTSSTGNPSDAFNPAVLSAPVSSVAASQATVNETFKYVFEHADAFTQMPSYERQAIINSNRYALSTDFNHNLGSLCHEHNNKAGWFRPYVTFENMSLRNGPKVDAITYGSLVGFDSDFQHFKKGWTGVTTGYVGYNGSQLNYSGVDTSMNGGILGLTQTLYKGNFWSALTLSAGASVGESSTMYGKEDFTSLLAGVGSKTGYNFEFKEGKYIIQPIMFMSYTFVNTFDYTNAAGVKINTSPAHSILLNPSVRFITNTKNGWQPYASVGMVWNVMNENKVTANNVRLPEMSMKPYVEYGLGIQKNWKDNFTAFGQAMIRNGGRNGIAFTAGMRWAIGHNHPEKVHNNAPKVKKVIKQAKI